MAKPSLKDTAIENTPEITELPYWKPFFVLATAALVIAGYYAGNSHSEIAGAGFG